MMLKNRFVRIMVMGLLSVMCLSPSSAQSKQGIRDALRTGGLRAAAKLNGTYVENYPETQWVSYDLKSLSRSSDEIVVARVAFIRSTLSNDGLSIESEFAITPIRSLKSNSETVKTFTLPGGLVRFEDRTSAEVRYKPESELSNSTGDFVLFLKKASDGSNYSPNGNGQGIIALDLEAGTSRSLARTTDAVYREAGELTPSSIQDRIAYFASSKE